MNEELALAHLFHEREIITFKHIRKKKNKKKKNKKNKTKKNPKKKDTHKETSIAVPGNFALFIEIVFCEVEKQRRKSLSTTAIWRLPHDVWTIGDNSYWLVFLACTVFTVKRKCKFLPF